MVLNKAEADRLDLEKDELAQNLIKAVRMEKGGLVKMCLPPSPLPLPQPYYLISALKQANHLDQHEQGVLGGVNQGKGKDKDDGTAAIIDHNYRWMSTDIKERIDRYEKHFEFMEKTRDSHMKKDTSYGGAASSEQFLRSEYDILIGIYRALERDLAVRDSVKEGEEEL